MDLNKKPDCVTTITANMQIYLPKMIRDMINISPGMYQVELREDKIVFLCCPKKYHAYSNSIQEVRLRPTWQFVLPQTFKTKLKVVVGDKINIYYDSENEEIYLLPVTNHCCICDLNEQEQLCSIMNKYICRNCIKSIIDIYSD